MTDRLRRSPAPLGEQLPDALAPPDQLDRTKQRVAAAEAEPRLVEQAAVHAFHRERDRAAGADRVDAELVAALGRAQHGIAVADTAQRSQRKQALVLDAAPPPSRLRRRLRSSLPSARSSSTT